MMMGDQQSQVLKPPRRVKAEERAGRPVYPRNTASQRPRRLGLRSSFWLLLIVAIIVGAVWYFPRSETRSKNGGRPTSGAAIPVGVSPVVKGDMPIIFTQLGTVAPLAMVSARLRR